MKKLLWKAILKILKNRFVLAALLLIVAGGLAIHFTNSQKKIRQLITQEVKRQDLLISVIEGGNLTALRSQKVINNVPGQRNILEVVDEGTRITEEDVRNGKVLVRLDSEDLKKSAEQRRIEVESSWAQYLDAQENLEIQKKQNESDIKQAELKVKFAQMDLAKYLGDSLADQVIKDTRLDYGQLISSPQLGGESLNKKKEVENRIDLANEELSRARDKVEWSNRLSQKGFITKTEFQADELALKQKNVALEQANLESRLFFNYDFPKQVEKLLSDYQESLKSLERTRANCRSRLIQGEASLKSRRSTYLLSKDRLEENEIQLKECTIVATQPGFVTYATSSRPWGNQSPIQPGTQVRQRQDLLTLPDFDSMGVEVKIHESAVEKVRVDQPAVIKVDAFPDRAFTGKVIKISLMPDPTLKWLNPDINVYVAQISFDQSYDFLKPGMSAQVEILVEKLEKVIAVPLVALTFHGETPYCTVLKNRMLETRRVTLGKSNDEMVEIKSGLAAGETLVISPGQMTPQIKKQELSEKGRMETTAPAIQTGNQPGSGRSESGAGPASPAAGNQPETGASSAGREGGGEGASSGRRGRGSRSGASSESTPAQPIVRPQQP
ncbi:MAG TPA: efflux RND transporter periplasmic adaptor subunit [bacterium]|nr:efflux RND transporter periplasmic adaptor subunit [bacterium]